MFDQPELEGYLRETALAEAGVTAHIGAEATALADEGDHVVIDGHQLDSGEAFRLSARYLSGLRRRIELRAPQHRQRLA